MSEQFSGLEGPLELCQEATNGLTVRDAGGDILFEYTSDEDDISKYESDRMEYIVAILNRELCDNGEIQ